jgi:hypothetical protein
VIPTSLLGLVVFAASIGPGVIWIWVAERRQPREKRSQLMEAAELVFVGGLFSTISFFAVLYVGDRIGQIHPEELAAQGFSYAIRHPGPGFGGLLIALGLSYASAFVAAVIRYSRSPTTIGVGRSGWHAALETGRVSPAGEKRVDYNRLSYVTAALRDGTSIAGWAFSYTVEASTVDDRELVLARPIRVRTPHSTRFVETDDHVAVIHGADVRVIYAKYHRVPHESAVDLRRRFANWILARPPQPEVTQQAKQDTKP